MLRYYLIGKHFQYLFRILTKELKAGDGQNSILGRFCQVLFDGSPIVMENARKAS